MATKPTLDKGGNNSGGGNKRPAKDTKKYAAYIIAFGLAVALVIAVLT